MLAATVIGNWEMKSVPPILWTKCHFAKSVNASTPLGKHALDIFNEFCEGGDSETDYSGISKKIGGDAWDYPFDPKGKK